MSLNENNFDPPNKWSHKYSFGVINNQFENYDNKYNQKIMDLLKHFKDFKVSDVVYSWNESKSINQEYLKVKLENSDFENGTIRITKPGYYYLTENIFFNPNSTNDFMPTTQQTEGENAEFPVAPFGPYSLGFFVLDILVLLCCFY